VADRFATPFSPDPVETPRVGTPPAEPEFASAKAPDVPTTELPRRVPDVTPPVYPQPVSAVPWAEVQAGSADANPAPGRQAAAAPVHGDAPTAPHGSGASDDRAGMIGDVDDISDTGGVDHAVTGPVDDFLPHAAAQTGSPSRRARRAQRPPRSPRARWGRARRGQDEPGPEWLATEPWRGEDRELSWLASEEPAAEAPVNQSIPEPPPVAPEPSRADEHDAAGRHLTAAGLPQRTRGVPPHEPAPVPAGPDQSESAPPANRAPEQVLDLLARFEAGRRRAASGAHNDGGAPDATDARVTQGPEDR
jgi:hypothetical protein